MKIGKTEEYILRKINSGEKLHMTLIDPDKTTPYNAVRIACEAEKAGTDAIMVGGSLGVSENLTDSVVKSIKEHVNIPVILFPGSVSGVSRYADALWFISVLNSINPYYIVGAQVEGAIIARKYNLECIPLAYIIVGEGGAAGYVSYARPIPYSRPELIVAYSLAAEYMGFRFIYLEAGSGGNPIPPAIVSKVKEVVNVPLIVGGGIRDEDIAYAIASAGADIIVTGTIVEEEENVCDVLSRIIGSIKHPKEVECGRRDSNPGPRRGRPTS